MKWIAVAACIVCAAWKPELVDYMLALGIVIVIFA